MIADVTAGFMFRIDQGAVDLHVENAAVARDEFRDDSEFILDGGRQTGGDRVVVSDLAELD